MQINLVFVDVVEKQGAREEVKEGVGERFREEWGELKSKGRCERGKDREGWREG